VTAQIVSAHDPAWDEAVERVGGDVYSSSRYHEACEANGDGTACAFIAQDGDAALFHPFLVRPIAPVAGVDVDEGLVDLESAYGYSGPLASGASAEFLGPAWAEFDTWCAAQRVVAEFIRFDPLQGNERFAPPDTEVARVRDSLVLDVSRPPAAIWDGYSSRQRNMVRRAERAGLTCRRVAFDEGIDAFVQLYDQTMRRVGAAPSYFFSRAYYDGLARLADRLWLFVVEVEGRVVAAALFLAGASTVHYHLSASDPHGRDGATNLLLHTAAISAREAGFSTVHLGGGRTGDGEDSLFRFKRALTSAHVPVHVGRRIHDRSAYGELCDRWLAAAGEAVRPNYFLLYRLPVPERVRS
jgi:GNAT acetyltransferase-like protein